MIIKRKYEKETDTSQNNAASKKHSHKKWKDSLETRAVLLLFSLELEIHGVALQSIHQNSKKW